MKFNTNSKRPYLICFLILAILITIGVIFITPQVGVADQGDFDRVMGTTGLSLLDSDKANPNFERFYKYIVTDYKICKTNIFITIISSSMGYLITLISFVCRLLGQTVFKTQYLAIAYSALYIFSIFMILKYLNIKNNLKLTLLVLLILFVFFDGNYLVWFNSLYGEPMMITTLLLFISSVLHYVHYKYVLRETKKLTSKIVYILIASLLFLGSKLQTITSLPFILILVGKILWDNKKILTKSNLCKLLVLFCIVIIYPIEINMTGKGLSNDTNYNSVFYGILNGSKTPQQDLIDLGLNPNMAVEAGKHSYLSKDKYIKYIPRTEITTKEFYSKISNAKLARFYITHPIRLIMGMEYTASKAFVTSTTLGKCSQETSTTEVTTLTKFTGWSYLRENKLPKHLWFILLVYILTFIISVYRYLKNKLNSEIKNKIFLLWILMFIGAIQFPMPYVGNGQADTAKQLFLFNFIFDIMLIIVVYYVISKIVDFIRLKKSTR